jgi:hypothetical protein
MNAPEPNLFSFAFVDPTMFLSTMTLKYGRHFDEDQPKVPEFPDCRTIILRGPSDGLWHVDVDQVDYPLMAEWASGRNLVGAVSSAISGLLGGANLQLGRAYVESLKSGGVIPWHVDGSAYAKAHQRFRLLASPCAGGCWFSGGESLSPGVGNLTYFNNRVLNSAINLGASPQISLIVDIRRPTLQ